MFFRRKTKENHEKLCFPEGKSGTRLCFFVGKTKENHAKSVQNVRKLLFSLGKTKEKQKKKKRPPPQKKKKTPKKKSTRYKRLCSFYKRLGVSVVGSIVQGFESAVRVERLAVPCFLDVIEGEVRARFY